MKRKIADWLYRFWHDNHTHNWDIVNDTYKLVDKKVLVPKKCRYCRAIEWRNI
jgi:hypothetical protein